MRACACVSNCMAKSMDPLTLKTSSLPSPLKHRYVSRHDDLGLGRDENEAAEEDAQHGGLRHVISITE